VAQLHGPGIQPVSEPILRTDGLSKHFGGLLAVDNVNIAFEAGRVHAIIGPNGAGKTTFFNLISGMLAPDTGRVFFAGQDITGLKPHQISRRGIKRTMQIKSVFPNLSVADNLWITAKAGDGFLHPFRPTTSFTHVKEKVDATLEQMGLSGVAGQVAGTLSYGNMALLEIGMALVSSPKLLLLDEPICGMSPIETEQTVDKIRALSKQVDIVIIEHDMEVVFGLADDITVMALGAVLASGTPQQIGADERVREAYLGRPEDDELDDEEAHA
jgi:branched-chain amino acid transport system ATP-binding protein